MYEGDVVVVIGVSLLEILLVLGGGGVVLILGVDVYGYGGVVEGGYGREELIIGV